SARNAALCAFLVARDRAIRSASPTPRPTSERIWATYRSDKPSSAAISAPGPDLTQTLARIESTVRGVTAEGCASFLESADAGREALAAAAEMKRLAGQINVTIHALGIL